MDLISRRDLVVLKHLVRETRRLLEEHRHTAAIIVSSSPKVYAISHTRYPHVVTQCEVWSRCMSCGTAVKPIANANASPTAMVSVRYGRPPVALGMSSRGRGSVSSRSFHFCSSPAGCSLPLNLCTSPGLGAVRLAQELVHHHGATHSLGRSPA